MALPKDRKCPSLLPENIPPPRPDGLAANLMYFSGHRKQTLQNCRPTVSNA